MERAIEILREKNAAATESVANGDGK
jgi:hypothetical protein